MRVQNAWNCLLVGALVACTAVAPVAAQSPLSSSKVATAAAETASGYNLPPKNILDVMRAPMPPRPVVSPTNDSILLVSWQEYPSIARVATPFLRLAGVRVEPKNHSKHDTPGGYGITPCATGFDLVHVADVEQNHAAQVHIALPAGACPGEPMWSADGKRFAFANIAPESVELWIGDAKTGEVHRVPGARLNPMFDDAMQWMPDQKTLLVKLVPKGMGAPPPEPFVPIGPSIQETEGEKGQSSTYENRDTLNNKHDEDLFDYYAASQLALVNAVTATITPIGKPANYESLDPAPDGQHILVNAIHKPYSYVVTYERFPKEVEVWDVSHPSTFFPIPSPRFPWRIAFPSTAFPPVRAIFPGVPLILRLSSMRRRWMAATGM